MELSETIPIDDMDEISFTKENQIYESSGRLLDSILSSVKCSAHTIQLAVWDVLKTLPEQLNEIREI